MTVYVIAQLKFTNVEPYRRYQEAFPAVWKKYRGRLLAADEQPKVVEGEWDGNKVVLLSFPDEAAYREWAESEEYKSIAKDRMAGAETISLLVQGIA
ncbi:MAG: DUF1330 domain-containing protein [Proteobacteria bacterium]|nr:DUF1330 domain-containing protein [Pseudomonadota bacterium]